MRQEVTKIGTCTLQGGRNRKGRAEQSTNKQQTAAREGGKASFLYFISNAGRCIADGGLLYVTLLVTAKEVFCLGVLEGAAGDEIDPDEDYKGDDEDHVCLPPFLPQIP